MSADVPYFGIDFGTTNSSMAWCDPKTVRAEIIYNAEGEPKTPSVVYFGEDGILVGKDAEEKLKEFEGSDDPEDREYVIQRIVRSIKRNLINPPVIPIAARKPVRPVEVVAQILKKLKRDAEEGHFYEEIERVVITCPAVFGAREQEVLLKAAEMAGFHRIELLEEPTAAALTVTRTGQKIGRGVMIYDLGAGTFDLSVVVREDDGNFRVAMEPEGDPKCGGDDLDYALYHHCDKVAQEDLGRSISLTEDVDLFFLKDCRARKENLSRREHVTFSSLLASNNGSKRFKYEVDRETFEALIQDRIKGTVKKTAKLWEQAKSRGHELDTLVLIGGSSRVPLVGELLEGAVTKPRSFAEKDFAVALGAAYHAFDVWKKDEDDVEVEETQEARELRRALNTCWNDRKLTRAETEWLQSLAKKELGLDPETILRIEREVLNDTLEGVLESQEPAARDHYRRVLEIGARDKKLDVLRRIPSARLNMLFEDRERFCEFDFADSPVSAAERKKLAGDLPWAIFAMAARVAADPDLSAATVAERLDAVADELGLSKVKAAEIERKVLGSTVAESLVQDARKEYRQEVTKAWADGRLTDAESKQLEASAKRLGLTGDQAATIERGVMSNTAAEVRAEQVEVRELARRHKIKLSEVSGSGKKGRVTKRDIEWRIKEQEREEQARKKQEESSRRKAMEKKLQTGLSALSGRLDEQCDSFVRDCASRAEKILDSDSDWSSNLGKCLKPALAAYTKGIQKEAQAEVDKLELGLTVPTFTTPGLSAQIRAGYTYTETPVADHAGKIGAGTGAAIGTAIFPGLGTLIGAGIGYMAGSAAEDEFGGGRSELSRGRSLDNVRTAARGLCPALKEEATKYLGQVKKAAQKSV